MAITVTAPWNGLRGNNNALPGGVDPAEHARARAPRPAFNIAPSLVGCRAASLVGAAPNVICGPCPHHE
eukprot:10523871-Lingulodinium_polyedra.AAC.1